MFRSLFILLSKVSWAQRLIMSIPIARQMAQRFIAGDTLDDAINVIKTLNQKDILATLDHLGENTTTPAEAKNAAQSIHRMIDAIIENDVRSNVSIKLSQLGFTLSDDVCLENLRSVLAYAKQKKIFIRIDMEDSSTVEKTIRFYNQMRKEGFDNTGLVIQAYLYRSEKDMQELLKTATKFRLCKGAYKEPAEVAFPRKADVDKNYDLLTTMLMDAALEFKNPSGNDDGRTPPLPAIATHDVKRIEYAREYAEKIKLPRSAYEFQMLHGIRRDIQEDLSKNGYRVRIYVPFGTQWYPYFMRRLAERPANVWFILSNLLYK
jgi:proline dehydrogenase